jgi:uncharacterized membrane protein YfcA
MRRAAFDGGLFCIIYQDAGSKAPDPYSGVLPHQHVSVVTGATSLITVPVMIQLGIEPHVAVATNMFALIFLSAGGLAPFWKGGMVLRRELPLMTILTIGGSVVGALLLMKAPMGWLQLVIAVAMIAVAVFSLVKRDLCTTRNESPVQPIQAILGYVLTLALAVYGGFFSGGYVTMLTAVFAMFFHMTFVESIATTKLMNLFSSIVAVSIFARRGIVDWRLGLILGIAMFVGGLLGGTIALKMNAAWLRRIFLVAVLAFAARMLYAILSA